MRVLPRRTLLLEEGTIAREVVIILKGEVELYRRLPNSKNPAKIEDQKIPLDNMTVGVFNDDQDKEKQYLAELAQGFFKFKPKADPKKPSKRKQG